jgi:guanylate kinase
MKKQSEGIKFEFGTFSKLIGATDKETRLGDYNYVPRNQFEASIANNELIEYTFYSGHYYGVPKKAVENLGDSIGLKAMDIIGAKSFKRIYGDRVTVIFLYRKTEELIASIMERDVPDAEKHARISQLEDEQKNRFAEEIDGVLKVDENDVDATITRLMHLLEAVK